MTYESIIAQTPPSDDRDWENQCARCGSSVHRVRCESCGGDGCLPEEDDGLDFHEGDDTCETCNGAGGWWICLSSEEFCNANPAPGRLLFVRGAIEWFTFDAMRDAPPDQLTCSP